MTDYSEFEARQLKLMDEVIRQFDQRTFKSLQRMLSRLFGLYEVLSFVGTDHKEQLMATLIALEELYAVADDEGRLGELNREEIDFVKEQVAALNGWLIARANKVPGSN